VNAESINFSHAMPPPFPVDKYWDFANSFFHPNTEMASLAVLSVAKLRCLIHDKILLKITFF